MTLPQTQRRPLMQARGFQPHADREQVFDWLTRRRWFALRGQYEENQQE